MLIFARYAVVFPLFRYYQLPSVNLHGTDIGIAMSYCPRRFFHLPIPC